MLVNFLENIFWIGLQISYNISYNDLYPRNEVEGEGGNEAEGGGGGGGGGYWIHPVRPTVRPSAVGGRMISWIIFIGFQLYLVYVSLGWRMDGMGSNMSVVSLWICT